MTCRGLIDFFWQYIYGEVSAEKRLDFQRHLAICSSAAATY